MSVGMLQRAREEAENFEIENGVLKEYKGSEKYVVILDSVTKIVGGSFFNGAFRGCESLKSVTIPDSVTKIGLWAFYGCTSLKSITIPDSVAKIGKGAFSDCESLESIDVSESNQHYASEDGVLFSKDKATLIQYPIGNKRKEYIIPDSVTEIGENAFDGCTSLKIIKLILILNHMHEIIQSL